MPPPRRFSAAPTLTCPHRNKSSSHSSSSLHHTYSIDSSESMITVIPAKGCLHEERTSRGSLSCNSGQGTDASGSFYALPRSPLSPRSPSRCSPNLLTPNTSEPPTAALEPPFSPGTTTTCSSIGPNTVVQQPITSQQQAQCQQQQQHHTINTSSTLTTRQSGDTITATTITDNSISSNQACPSKIQVQSSLSNGSCYNLTLPNSEQANLDATKSNLSVLSGDDDNLCSLAVENGTSYNSSRIELFDELNSEAGLQTDLEEEADATITNNTNAFGIENYDSFQNQSNYDHYESNVKSCATKNDHHNDNKHNEKPSTDDYGDNLIDPDEPTIRESINEFCTRHSREELEFLIGQIGYLKIIDCYFSKKSSTLCMIIEVQDNTSSNL